MTVEEQIRDELKTLEIRRVQLERALEALSTVPRHRNGPSKLQRSSSGEHRGQPAVREAMAQVTNYLGRRSGYEGSFRVLAEEIGLPDWRVRRAMEFLVEDGVVTKNGERLAKYKLAEGHRTTVVKPGEGVSEGRVIPGVDSPA